MTMEIDLDFAAEKDATLGRDFLTWLWFKSEQTGGMFHVGSGEAVLYMEQRMSVQGGQGEETETAVYTGAVSEFREAKLGLSGGKKVRQARIRIEQDQNTWQLQLKAEDFAPTGFKTPKIETRLEEGDDPDAPFLEKMFLLERALAVMDDVYEQFLKIRLGPEWDRELAAARAWLAKS